MLFGFFFKQTKRDREIERDRQADRQTERETQREIDRQTDIILKKRDRQT